MLQWFTLVSEIFLNSVMLFLASLTKKNSCHHNVQVVKKNIKERSHILSHAFQDPPWHPLQPHLHHSLPETLYFSSIKLLVTCLIIAPRAQNLHTHTHRRHSSNPELWRFRSGLDTRHVSILCATIILYASFSHCTCNTLPIIASLCVCLPFLTISSHILISSVPYIDSDT